MTGSRQTSSATKESENLFIVVSQLRMPYTTILLIVCCAVFYYRVGESEYGSGGPLALASVALWAIASFALGFGWLGNLLVQVALFFALTVWNMIRRGRKGM